MLNGLSGQYYTPPPQVRVMVPQPNGWPDASLPTAETTMQEMANEYLNDPSGFMTGAFYVANPSELTANAIAYARSICQAGFYPQYTCVGFDPVARGTYYANLIINTLKTIPASLWNQGFSGSVYDAWIQGVPVHMTMTANALDNVAPHPVVIPEPTYTNAINPPVASVPLTAQQIANAQTATPNVASSAFTSAEGWLTDHWKIAAIIAAVLLLPGMMGGKR